MRTVEYIPVATVISVVLAEADGATQRRGIGPKVKAGERLEQE